MLRLGFAQTDITPEKPVNLVGFYREDNLSKGVLEPLVAQAAVWEGTEKCCLIAIDSIGFTRELSDRLRERIGKALDIPADRVMVCFSHTHAAPDADTDRVYYRETSARIEACALRAAEDLTPVTAGWDNAEAKIGVNRRWISEETDDRIGILKVCDEKGSNPKLLILRVTAHGNVLKADNCRISPDYFGNIRKTAGTRFGCPVMVIQGSAGSTAPRYFCSVNTPVDARSPLCIRSDTALADMADLITESIGGKYDGIKQHQECPVRMYARHIELTADVPSVEEAEQVAKDAREKCGIVDTGWLEKVKALNEAGVRFQKEDVEMQYFSVGGWQMCGGPYEFMAGFALETSGLLKNEFFYMNGYTNGCLLYFPTADEFDAGGYEVFWSMLIYYPYVERVYPFRRDEAGKLIRFVCDGALPQSMA